MKIGEHAGKVVGIILVSDGNSKRKCSVVFCRFHTSVLASRNNSSITAALKVAGKLDANILLCCCSSICQLPRRIWGGSSPDCTDNGRVGAGGLILLSRAPVPNLMAGAPSLQEHGGLLAYGCVVSVRALCSFPQSFPQYGSVNVCLQYACRLARMCAVFWREKSV